jgi:colicin V production protein
MLIWILAVVLFAAFGALGYAKGAIRMIFPLVGLVLGAILAVPLGPLVKPVIPLVGLKNPIWSLLLPPVLVFLLIALIFIIVGFIVHRKVYLHFKYQTDDYQRLSWERMNKRIGVCIGLVAGASYTILIGLVIYIMGYLTVQVSADDKDSAAVRYLNQARADLRASGLEKTVAAFDPAPAGYYLASDIVGLLYHNPLLNTRLAGYPPFLALGDRQEFQDIANDTEFQNMLQTQATVGQIVNHPKTQTILNSQEIIQQIEQTDLKDLREYLKTGESPKYADVRILGRWQMDPYATLLQMKRRRTGITTAEMRLMKQQLEFVRSYSLVVTPDNNVKLKGPDVMPLIQKYIGDLTASYAARRTTPQPAAAAPAAAPAPAPTQPSVSAQMAQRYGLRGATPPPAPASTTVAAAAPAPAAAAPTPGAIAAEIAALPVVVLAQGTWKEAGDRYEVALEAQAAGFKFNSGGKSATVEADIRDGRLYLTESDATTVMVRF